MTDTVTDIEETGCNLDDVCEMDTSSISTDKNNKLMADALNRLADMI